MSDPRTVLDLSGTWHYRIEDEDADRAQISRYPAPDLDRSDWKPMTIPNNWYLTEVGDYFGALWFATEFTVPQAMAGQHLTLRFHAVDYYADVWLNGEYLGHHEGYFTPFEFDVTGKILADAPNVLVVKDDAPRDPTDYLLVESAANLALPLSTPYKRHWAKELTMVKGHHIDAMHRPGAMTKYRGDGNSGGIWQPVELIARGQVQIEKVKIYPRYVEKDGSAVVSVDLELHNSSDDLVETELALTIRAKNFTDPDHYARVRIVQLQPGRNTIKLIKTVPNVKRWWTWDHGDPNLYTAEIVVGADQPWDAVTETFGVKTIEQDSLGQWYLNGKRIFLRGMRYFPSLWLSEMNESRYRQDLEKMLDLNINSIRLGSHVELPIFYDLCDEMGFLLWQVFPLHYCYSDSDELIEKAASMMREMVSMLHNHAAIGMWSVFKEPKIYGLPNPPNNYDRLCAIMYEAARSVDPIRWVHKGDYDEGVKNVMIGCVLPGDTDPKKIKLEPNIVEYGCGIIPRLETLQTFIPEDKLWPPDWDTWEYYGLFYDITFNKARIEMGNSVEEFIENSQNYAARSIKEQAEFFRQRKYRPVSSMYLYFWNDCWAGIGCGLLDYYRRENKAYADFKLIYTPVLVSLEWNRDPYHVGWQKHYKSGDTFVGNLWVTNDHLHDIRNITLRWRLLDKQSGQVVDQAEHAIAAPADTSRITEQVVWPIPRGTKGLFRVEMQLMDGKGAQLSQNYFEFEVAG